MKLVWHNRLVERVFPTLSGNPIRVSLSFLLKMVLPKEEWAIGNKAKKVNPRQEPDGLAIHPTTRVKITEVRSGVAVFRSMVLAMVPFFATPALAFKFNLQFAAVEVPGLVPLRTAGLLVVDTDGDGFAGINDPEFADVSDLRHLSLCPGGRVGDDLVLAVLSTAELDGVTSLEPEGLLTVDTEDVRWEGMLGEGQDLGLYIFYDGDVDVGSRVGFYRSDAVTDRAFGGTTPYRIPAAGATAVILSVDESLGGSVSKDDFEAMDKEVPGAGESYSLWISELFPGDPDAPGLSPLSDPDGDGWSNIEEYYFSSDPASVLEIPRIRVANDGTVIQFRRRRHLSSDVRGQLLWSRDLRAWKGSGTTIGKGGRVDFCPGIDSVSGSDTKVDQSVMVRIDDTDSPEALFYRVEIVFTGE